MVNSATELNKHGILQVKFAEVHVVSLLASSILELLVKCGTYCFVKLQVNIHK